jgi:hypothetical protein
VSADIAPTILSGVGYNPYRKFKAKTGDLVMVAACTLIAVALLAWAFFA